MASPPGAVSPETRSVSVHRDLAGRLTAGLDRWVTSFDAGLTGRRVRWYATLGLVVSVVAYGFAAIRGDLPFDLYGHPVAVDLTNRVTGGRTVLDRNLGHLYVASYQWQLQQAILGGRHPEFFDVFVSPPFVAYLYAPLAALPYWVAAVIWTIVSLALLLASLRLLWPLVPRLQRHGFWTVLVVTVASWPAMETFIDGQDSTLSLFVLTAGLRLLLANQDLLAGAALALGLYKPQLFILVPVFLILLRRWWAVAAWLAVALALVLSSVAAVGVQGVAAYRSLLSSDLYHNGLAYLTWKMQSIGGLLDAALPASSTLIVSGLTIGVGAVLLVALARGANRSVQTPATVRRMFAMLVLTVALTSPHFYLYDSLILVLPAILLLDEVPARREVRMVVAVGYIATWTASAREAAFGQGPAPLVIVAGPWLILSVIGLLGITARLMRSRADSEVLPEIEDRTLHPVDASLVGVGE